MDGFTERENHAEFKGVRDELNGCCSQGKKHELLYDMTVQPLQSRCHRSDTGFRTDHT